MTYEQSTVVSMERRSSGLLVLTLSCGHEDAAPANSGLDDWKGSVWPCLKCLKAQQKARGGVA